MLDFESFCGYVTDELGAPTDERLDPNTNVSDNLALDSLQAYELIVIVESLADLHAPPADMPEIYTLQDAYEYYQVCIGVSRSMPGM